jgi:hypothetical protein
LARAALVCVPIVLCASRQAVESFHHLFQSQSMMAIEAALPGFEVQNYEVRWRGSHLVVSSVLHNITYAVAVASGRAMLHGAAYALAACFAAGLWAVGLRKQD